MYKDFLMRLVALCAFAGLSLWAAYAVAAKLNIGDFTAACSDDPSVTEDPSFEDKKVTPKAFCECVAGALEKNNLSQKDIDMLTKMHNEELTDADAESTRSQRREVARGTRHRGHETPEREPDRDQPFARQWCRCATRRNRAGSMATCGICGRERCTARSRHRFFGGDLSRRAR